MYFLKLCNSVHLLSIGVFQSATVTADTVSGSKKKTEVLVLVNVSLLTNLAKYTNNIAKKPWLPASFTVTAVSLALLQNSSIVKIQQFNKLKI